MIMTEQKEQKTKQKGNAWEKTAFCQHFRENHVFRGAHVSLRGAEKILLTLYSPP